MKAVVAKSVIFTAFINDANIAMSRGFFIGYDAINLTHFERRLVSLIIDAEGKLVGHVLFFHCRLGLAKVSEVFYGNVNFLARFLALDMEFVESFFNIPQYLTFEILLAAIRTLKTWHIIYDKKFAIVPVNVLRLARLEIFMTTESASCFHPEPRS